MGISKSKFYFSALLAAFLFIAPNSSWATFNLLRDAQVLTARITKPLTTHGCRWRAMAIQRLNTISAICI